MNSDIEDLVKKVMELKKLGLPTSDVAKELNLDGETIVWLSLKPLNKLRVERISTYVDLTNIYSSSARLEIISSLLSDLIESELGDVSGKIVVNVGDEDVPLATLVARSLEIDFCLIKEAKNERGETVKYFSINFKKPVGREVIIVQSVVSTGAETEQVIDKIREIKGTPVGVFCLANNSIRKNIRGIPIHPLIKVTRIAGGRRIKGG
ncbi:hypothetical protein DRN86_05065 [Candidatus Geothermarchaeota archaeon]|nr:MAG: hypothetical protein DRN86_05065 [Candidatus Geothermarchaeota archaeon]